MDYEWFFLKRIEFLRSFYETGTLPFREQQLNIELEKPPFDNPPYNEDGEPPFLEEWMDAKDSEEILARSCLSMLSDSLKQYLNDTREFYLRLNLPKGSKGFVKSHISLLCSHFGEPIDECPINLGLLEQIALARNQIQHDWSLTSHLVMLNEETLRTYPFPFFAEESEQLQDLERPSIAIFRGLTQPSIR